MKKALIVIPTLEQGGGQKFVLDLASGLDKTRFQVKLLVFYNNTGSVFDQAAAENGIDAVYLGKRVGIDWKLFRKVRKIVREYDPDIIHTNIDSMLYMLPVYKKKHTKLHTVHSMAEKEAVGLQRVIREIAFLHMGVVPVAISGIVANSIASVYGIDKRNIPVVNNGVDYKRYDLPKSVDARIRFVSVGTLYGVKNHEFLLECFAAVRKSCPDVCLTLVGDGVLRERLEAQIKTLGIADCVTITGVVSDVENYLAAADIYAASSHYEGLPLSMLEAMAAGLPVISTNVGGVSEIVKHGVNGFLVEPQDKDAYVAAMLDLARNADRRQAYSMAAKKIARSYDVDFMIAGYSELYCGKTPRGVDSQ